MLDEQKVAAMDLVNYMKGALWWGREYLLRRLGKWYSDRYDHPLLSVCEKKVTWVREHIPMLVGSSSCRMKKSILVKMDEDQDTVTYFNTRIRPVIYMDDFFMRGVPLERGVKVDQKELSSLSKRSLRANFPKTHVNEEEMQAVERFIEKSKRLVRGGGLQ